MKRWAPKQTGFTIVELLIVIVVIAILAAITIVAFNGVQQRANNTAVIDAVGKTQRVLQAYIASTGKYPYTTNDTYVCITVDTTCRRNTGPMGVDPTLQATVASVGTLPTTAPLASDVRGGITYHYLAARTVDGVSLPLVLSYYLRGINVNCGFPALSTEAGAAIVTSTGYTSGNVGSSGVTHCAISVQGPAHS